MARRAAVCRETQVTGESRGNLEGEFDWGHLNDDLQDFSRVDASGIKV